MHSNPYESPQLKSNGEVPESKTVSSTQTAISLLGIFVFLASLKVLVAQFISVFIGGRYLYKLQPFFGIFQLLICAWLSTVLINLFFSDRSKPFRIGSGLTFAIVLALFLQKFWNYYLVIVIRNALSFFVPVSE